MIRNGADSPRLLYVDAYDSFANNIVGLLETRLNAEVTIVQIDNWTLWNILRRRLAGFHAIVVGPGPGNPTKPDDVGLINQIWNLNEAEIVPVFGICLGFQSLGHAFGARISKLKRARHGIVSTMVHQEKDIFESIGSFQATQYHSLQVDLGHAVGRLAETRDAIWKLSTSCPSLEPLAWDLDDIENGKILMGLRHTSKPLWGVQFHPESICTSTGGSRLLETWWHAAMSWLAISRPQYGTTTPQSFGDHGLLTPPKSPVIRAGGNVDATRIFGEDQGSEHRSLLWATHNMPDCSVPELVERLRTNDNDVVFLDSQGHQTGRYSILGLIRQDDTLRVTYNVCSKQFVRHLPGGISSSERLASVQDVWSILRSSLLRPISARSDNQLPLDSPFWGGWMGYITYEGGLRSINVNVSNVPQQEEAADFDFAFIERSVVFDHIDELVYVQSLVPDDGEWLDQIRRTIIPDQPTAKKARTRSSECLSSTSDTLEDMEAIEDRELSIVLSHAAIEKPDERMYRQNVLECQRSLADGESYELCYTDETRVFTPTTMKSWSMYKRLRRKNPAPFGAFLQLSGTTIVGSSPERFLHWDRDGKCQLRPIKGTVKKTPDMTYEKASVILNTSKERAENLMIVDLIRHDLSGVIGARNCSVPKLMQVEEYKTVFQLVSVIEGRIPKKMRESSTAPSEGIHRPKKVIRPKDNDRLGIQGIDVLKASLPPGSMTGAPKKRSCEILAKLESRPRGVYSGVLGYLDVGGGGDFSVIIRSAFRHDTDFIRKQVPPGQRQDSEDLKPIPCHIWRIGAGGAVTIQSTDTSEFEEMEAKLDTVLSSFLV